MNFDHGKVEPVKSIISETKELVLDIPLKKVDESILPGVTVMVVTRNRKQFAGLIIDNWKRVNYPPEKLQLLIIDDSDDTKMGPIMELKALKDPRISYCYIKPSTTDIPHTIGSKRNHGMTVAKYDFVCMLDDDDFMYNDSILARVLTILSYKKGCVYSDQLGVYNLKHESSYVIENIPHVPEGTMMITKAFWLTQKFSETAVAESIGLISGREMEMMKIPWFYNCVALYHGNNHTMITKNMHTLGNRNKMRKAMEISLNIWKTAFPKSFQTAVKLIPV